MVLLAIVWDLTEVSGITQNPHFRESANRGSTVDHFDWIRARLPHIYTNQVSYM